MNHFIGLDLGGTFLKAGVVNEQGEVLGKKATPTGPGESADSLIRRMIDTARDVVSDAGKDMDQISGIGIGSPGPIDFGRGILAAAPNLPNLKNLPIRDLIGDALGKPTILENDANAAALGAYWAGVGKNSNIKDMIMLTLGTGVGSGIIVDGHIFHGGRGYGGEAGHMIVAANGRLCNCGQRGCLEAYASATQTARRATENLINTDEASTLRRVMKESGVLTGKDICDAAKAGDGFALRTIGETATHLGVACVNLCRLFDPQLVVLGGGLALAGDFLIDRVKKAYLDHDWHATESSLKIVAAQLGYDTGVIGAAAVAWDEFNAKKAEQVPQL